MEMSAFPAVATVIGLSKEVAESGPLVATLAVDTNMVATPPPAVPIKPLEIQAGDPVTQAVVDNIIGKHPTKKEPVTFRCEVCKISVSSEEILNIHYSGAKHARKVKGQELFKEITNSPHSSFIVSSSQDGSGTTDFTCKMCNVRVNSQQQLQQHLSGSKHKSKAETSISNTPEVYLSNGASGKGAVNVDIGPNRLYCAACNVHVNSDLQLHQHITSIKHANKVNGKTASGNSAQPRWSPYNRPKVTQSTGTGGTNTSSWQSSGSASSWQTSGSASSWHTSGSASSWPTSGNTSNWQNSNNHSNWHNKGYLTEQRSQWQSMPKTVMPTKNFLSGGMLYHRR